MSRKTVTFEKNPLFGGPTLAERNRGGSPYRLIPVSDVDVDPEQPRKVFDEEALLELSSSIGQYGVICPILVQVTAGGSYRLIAGERRLRAAKLAGLETIPAVVDTGEGPNSDILNKQLVENLQREQLSPMERSIAIGQLKDRYGLSIRDIAKKLGISKSVVQRSLEILSLPDDLQAALVRGASETKVLLLAQVEDREIRKDLIAQIEDQSREQLEAMIVQLQGKKVYHRGTVKVASKMLSVEDARIIEDLQKSLGSKVAIVRSAKKKKQGKLILEFYSAEELEEIYRRLT